jgi:D-glycero-alpha-D-manno-heptose 1-phosphate guanylyltransferase
MNRAPFIDIPAVLLVGGLGTRLRSVLPSTPKALATLGGRSFLDLLVRQLHAQGVRRLVMCTGFLADQIESMFGSGSDWGVQIQYSQESYPMGTAGAIRLAQRHLPDDETFLVMNGDSFLEIDLAELVRFHGVCGGLASIAIVETEQAGRYGTVLRDATGRVTGFLEKSSTHTRGFINGGVYVFDRAIFEQIPDGPVSLEKEVFPRILNHGVFALVQQGIFIDIGVPGDYAHAQSMYGRLQDAILPKVTRL